MTEVAAGDVMTQMNLATVADIERFLRYVDKLPSGCWYWTGARSRGKGNRKWYGSFRCGRHVVRVHRFASEIIGRMHCPAGCHRDHTCGFSMCVNPAHIEIVTHEENEIRKQQRRRERTAGSDEHRLACDPADYRCGTCGDRGDVADVRADVETEATG